METSLEVLIKVDWHLGGLEHDSSRGQIFYFKAAARQSIFK